MSDHHVFRTHGIPYLFLSCGRWKHYHQPSDTPARLNYVKMARISHLLVDMTVKLADAPSSDIRRLPPARWNATR